MRCDDARRHLNALADGELTGQVASGLNQHMAECPACSREYAAICRLGAAARAYGDVCAPATLLARIVAALTSASEERCGESSAMRNGGAERFGPPYTEDQEEG